MRKTNIASGGYTPLQVGRVVPVGEAPTPEETAASTAPGTVANIRSGNARVGHQADEIRSGLTIRL